MRCSYGLELVRSSKVKVTGLLVVPEAVEAVTPTPEAVEMNDDRSKVVSW
jgi:hypothetical protein